MNNVENKDNTEKNIDYWDFMKPSDLIENTEDYNITLIAAVLLGVFGVHRFINKKYITGIIMLLTFGGFTLWVFVDIYLIISRKFKNAEGETLVYGGEFYEHPPNLLAICICIAICSGFIRLSNIDNGKVNTTSETEQTQSTVEAELEQTVATEEVPLEVSESSNEVELSRMDSTEAVESKTTASADMTGKFKNNSFNADTGIILEKASIKEGKESERYDVGCTLRNNTSDQTFKNAMIKITINNKDGETWEHMATVLTDDVLKPNESKNFTFDRHAKGDVTDVELELISYEEVK